MGFWHELRVNAVLIVGIIGVLYLIGEGFHLLLWL
jgi:hypothetical protein